MRVLLLTPLFPPDTGGAAVAFNLYFELLCEDQEVEQVTVLCEQDACLPRAERVHRKGLVLRYLPLLGRIDGYDTRSVTYRSTRVLIRSISMLCLLPVLSRVLRLDVIHFHCTFGHVQGRFRNRIVEWALRLSRGRTVCDVQDQRGLALHRRTADAFCAASLKICEDLRTRKGTLGARIEYTPVPFQSELARGDVTLTERPSIPALPEPYFCFVGDLSRHKGIHLLLEAHSRLLGSANYNLSLVLAGRDKSGGSVARQAGDRTHYLGVLSHEEALEVIRGASFLILPSISEGIPRVCLEALALGTPIVYPPGIEEFRRHIPGYMLPEISVEAIEAMIRKMLEDNGQTQEYPLHLHDACRLHERLKALYTPQDEAA